MKGADNMTQCERIQRHLEDYGSITSLEAMQEYGIMRLASRISDLKQMGVPIEKEMVSGKNRYGELTSFARYSLKVVGTCG
jgi:hypothetical protein|nr:MAG TPA: helix-turn-helix domain protein [Caudoviricetes sp.]